MKYDKEVDDVGAVEGGHVKHKDDLHSLNVDHSQDVGQGPQQAFIKVKVEQKMENIWLPVMNILSISVFTLKKYMIDIYLIISISNKLYNLLFFFPLELICCNF